MTEEIPKAKGLIRKLCEVMALTGWVEKSGRNQKQGYAYATEADVLSMLRKELAKRDVFIFPSIEKVERAMHSKTSGGYDMFITDVMVKWTFLDGETGETHECLMPGCGTDTGDKGLYKAITGSSKYMFLKAFMLPTGDDPEEDKDDPKVAKADAQAVGKRKVRETAERMGDATIALTEWKQGLIAVSGHGLAILKSEVESDKLKELGFKLDGNVVTIPAAKSFALEDLCKLAKVEVYWAESAKQAAS